MRHANAIKVMGQMVEFTAGNTSSEDAAVEMMVEAGIERAPIYFRGAAPGEWVELDGATLRATVPGK